MIEKEIDFEELIRSSSHSENSLYKDLLNPEIFKSVKLDDVFGSIYWDNGIDFCPDYLYSLVN